MAKLIIALYMESDASLQGCKVKNMSLLEDLSRVDYLFCDKTGTLTQNHLLFRGLCLKGGLIVADPKELERCADLEDFVRVVCLCHDVTRVKNEGPSFLTGSSQDELELLKAVSGFKIGQFVDRDSETIKIEVFGRIEVWRNLKMFEFSSERKMMSRLMENVETGEVRLFLKGADCAVMDRSTVVDGKLVEAVDGFANRGLRTLAFATRPFA